MNTYFTWWMSLCLLIAWFPAAGLSGQKDTLQEQAYAGDANAQLRMGLAYAKGIDVDQDIDQAAKWFLMAANQGNAAAQYNMGMLFKYGKGVIQDAEQSKQWLLKSAAQGFQKALAHVSPEEIALFQRGESAVMDNASATMREQPHIDVVTDERDFSNISNRDIQSSINLKHLVEESVAGAEAAFEAAGVEYYGKERTGVLGNRLWYFDVGYLNANDDSFYLELDPGFSFSTGMNFPLAKHVDFNVGMGYSQQEGTLRYYDYMPYTQYGTSYGVSSYYNYYTGIYQPYIYSYTTAQTYYRQILIEENFDITSLSALACFYLSLLPDRAINPFLAGGALYMNQNLESDSFSAKVSELGFLAGGGFECKLGRKFSAVPSVVYSKVDEVEETSVSMMLGYWYAFRHAVRLSGSYGTESKDISVRLGIMYSY